MQCRRGELYLLLREWEYGRGEIPRAKSQPLNPYPPYDIIPLQNDKFGVCALNTHTETTARIPPGFLLSWRVYAPILSAKEENT